MDSADYPFNDEFLLSERDHGVAQSLYEKVYPALDHPELRDYFAGIDKNANAAKRRSRRWGFAAVGLVTIALLGLSADELFKGTFLEKAIVAISAAASITGVALGAFGVLFANSKREWLENRFLTERLRQFHFQILTALAPEIVDAAVRNDWTAFRKQRNALLEKFKQDVAARRSSMFDAAVSDDEQEPWMVPFAERTVADDEISRQLFAAYAHLRIQRQIKFTEFKLQKKRALLSPFPKDQAARLAGIAMACVLVLVGLHILIAIGVFHDLGFEMPPLHVAAIWVAVIALAVRTLEEGLRPGREVERYRAYQSGLKAIGRRFERGDTPAAKIKAMAALEVLSFDEMVNFLKSNCEARFVM